MKIFTDLTVYVLRKNGKMRRNGQYILGTMFNKLRRKNDCR